MFCANCGAQVPDGTKFCPSCGKPCSTGEKVKQAAEDGKLSSAKKAENITTKSVVKRGEDGNYDPAKNTVNVQISASFKDAVLTVTNECTDIHGLPFELESGAYQVTFEFTNADTGSYINVVYYVTVK